MPYNPLTGLPYTPGDENDPARAVSSMAGYYGESSAPAQSVGEPAMSTQPEPVSTQPASSEPIMSDAVRGAVSGLAEGASSPMGVGMIPHAVAGAIRAQYGERDNMDTVAPAPPPRSMEDVIRSGLGREDPEAMQSVGAPDIRDVPMSDPDAAKEEYRLRGPGSPSPVGGPLEIAVAPLYAGGSPGRIIPGGMGPYAQAIQTTQGQPYPEEAIREQMEANRNMAEAAKRDREAKEYRARFETGKAINQARIEAEAAREEAALAKKHADTLAIKRAEYENTTIDPNRVWNNMSTFQQVAATIAIALGGGLAAVKGGPNLAYEMIKDKVDADIAAQHANREAMGKSMTMLGLENEQRTKTLEQERLERMKSLEGLFHTKLQAYNVPGNEAHAAFLRELAEQYHEEVAKLILAVSKQEADKVVVEEQNRYREAKVVGASGPRLMNPLAVFTSAKAAALRRGQKETDAEDYATKTLIAAGASKRDVAEASLIANQTMANQWRNPTGGSDEPVKGSLADPARQRQLEQDTIWLDDERGVFSPGMSQGIRSAIYNTASASNLLVQNIDEALGEGVGGKVVWTPEKARANVRNIVNILKGNDILKRDTLTDSDRNYLEANLPSMSTLWDVNGVNEAGLRAWREFAVRAKENAIATQGGAIVRRARGADPYGNVNMQLVFTGEALPPTGAVSARYNFTKDAEGEEDK